MLFRTWLTGLAAATCAVLLLGSTPAGASTTPMGGTPAQSCPVDVHAQKQQLRAMWIASVANIDWPSAPGLTPDAQQAELRSFYDLAVSQHHNAVVVQVRPTADAFWPSSLEPWSRYLTGTQGQDPGYDPLAFAVAEAHQRNLEFHAWFNPYRITMNRTTDVDTLALTHPAKVHPEWTIGYGGKLYYNPGVPEARAFVESAVMDAVTKYDIDAVHFDDYFYPYPVVGEPLHDEAQYAAYGNGMSLGDWRRDNINKLVLELGHQIKAAKSWVKFGISPFAVWMNQSNDPLGSATQAGAQTYTDLYADTRRWVTEGWIDYVAPQIYWAQSLAVADYDIVSAWWADVARGTGVQVYVGQATYKVGTSTQSPEWNSLPAELSNHLLANTAHPEIQGDIYFSAKDVRADGLGAQSLLTQTWYSHPALMPPMARIDGQAPRQPLVVPGRWTRSGATVTIVPSDRTTTSYAVYRLEDVRSRVSAGDCRLADATNLVATTRAAGWAQTWTDATAQPGHRYTYVVTALDRSGNESAPSQADVRSS